MRIRIAEPPKRKIRSRLRLLYCERPPDFPRTSCSVSSFRSCKRAKNSNTRKDVLPRPPKWTVQIVLHPGTSAFSEGFRNSYNTKTSFDGKKTESAETVVEAASSRTTGLASRGSSYTKVQTPMESDKVPPGVSNTTVPAFFPSYPD